MWRMVRDEAGPLLRASGWTAVMILAGVATGFVVPHVVALFPSSGSLAEEGTVDMPVLFAHRGGVRDDSAPENTLPALRAAVRRGYLGIEVDVRETEDGVLIAHHDAGFERLFACACEAEDLFVCRDGDYEACAARARRAGKRRCHLADMTTSEILELEHRPSGARVATLEAFLREAGGAGMAVMIDFKERLSPEGVAQLESLLRTHLPNGPVYFIGKTDPKLAITRRAENGRFGVVGPLHPIAHLAGKAVGPSEPFVFQDARTIRRVDVAYARALGVELIPTLNWHHLRRSTRSEVEAIALAHAELRRLWALGVRTFQIDPDFDGVFFDVDPGDLSGP